MKSYVLRYGIVCLVLALASTSGAAITVYTDLDAWRAGLGSYQTETFNDGVLDFGITVWTDNGYITGGQWSDRVAPGANETTWSFSSPLSAWAAEAWDLAGPNGPGTGIEVYLDGVAVPSEIPPTTAGTFWGVTSTVPFSEVRVTAGTSWSILTQETYLMDNMSISTASPAPGAILLGALGASLVGWLRRRTIL